MRHIDKVEDRDRGFRQVQGDKVDEIIADKDDIKILQIS